MWSTDARAPRAGAASAFIRRAALLLAGASLIAFAACHLEGTGGKTYMDIRGDSSWTGFDTLQVLLEDGSGGRIAVLFDRRLLSLGELSRLPAQEYPGGAVRIVIIGKKEGAVVFKEERVFDGRVTVSRDTLVAPPGTDGPRLLDLRPDNLTLFLGGGKDTLEAAPLADWAGLDLSWSSSNTGVVAVSGRGILEAKGVGQAQVRASRGDAFDQSLITVVRDAPVLDAGAADTAILINSTVPFHVKATQAYGTIASFAWDLDGDGKWDDSLTSIPAGLALLSTPPRSYPVAGFHAMRFYVRDGEGNAVLASKGLTVSDKVPAVDSLRVRPALMNIRDSAAFSAVAKAPSGALAKFAWDYDGDGKSDDSGSLGGTRASLSGGFRYPDSGNFQAGLKITDAEGVSVTQRVALQVKLDRPVADAGADIDAAPGAKVTLRGKANDTLGQIEKREWKIGAGPGGFGATATGDTTITAPASGGVMCYFRAVDDDGLAALDSVRVNVVSAAAPSLSVLYSDTLVSIRDSLAFSAKAQAGDSPLKSYSWDFGKDGVADLFGVLSGDEATIIGGRRFLTAGTYPVVLKVTDEAGGAATAEKVVTVRQDVPFAYAGADTTVPSGGLVRLHGIARDTLGSIVKREWKIGNAPFAAVSGNDTSFAMPSADSGITCVFRVTDDDGQTASDTVVAILDRASNADLSDLVPSAGALNPPFSPDRTAYAIAVNGDLVKELNLTPTAASPGATIKVVNWTVASGKPSIDFTLHTGETSLPVEVTSPNGLVVKTYSVVVNRSPGTVATLKSLTVAPDALDPGFSPTRFNYTINAVDSFLTVVAVTTDPSSTMMLDNYVFRSGVTGQIPLSPGTKVYPLTVTAPDRTTKLTYNLTVKRPDSSGP